LEENKTLLSGLYLKRNLDAGPWRKTIKAQCGSYSFSLCEKNSPRLSFFVFTGCLWALDPLKGLVCIFLSYFCFSSSQLNKTVILFNCISNFEGFSFKNSK